MVPSMKRMVRQSLLLLQDEGPCSSWTAAGWTYCALGAMSFLGKREDLIMKGGPSNVWPSEESNRRLLSWLVSLQTSVIQEEDVSAPDQMEGQPMPDTDTNCEERASEKATVLSPEDTVSDVLGAEPLAEDLSWAGMTGRCNKVADTCYAFWAGGSLMVRTSAISCDRRLPPVI